MASATPVAVPSAVWPVPWADVVPGCAMQSCPRWTSLASRVSFIFRGCFLSLLHRLVKCTFLATVAAVPAHVQDSCPWYGCNCTFSHFVWVFWVSWCIDDVHAVAGSDCGKLCSTLSFAFWNCLHCISSALNMGKELIHK